MWQLMPDFSARAFSRRVLSLVGQLLLLLAIFSLLAFVLDKWRGRHMQVALPDEAFSTLNGEPVNLAQYSDQSLSVLYVWASWCGPCKVTTPAIGRLSQSYPVVSIALHSGDDQAVLADAAYHLKNSPLVNDPEGRLADRLGVQITPSVIYMRDGKIVAYTSGISSYWGLWLRAKWLQI